MASKAIWGGNEAYQSGNYKVVEAHEYSDECVLFCSSNEIWWPNTEEVFNEAIVKKNRFEWEYIRYAKPAKIIYIRDIYKSWYVTGINQEIDSVDKLVEFVKEQSKGLRLICIGSSSGGYIATLIGCLLKADHVITFSGQMELYNEWAYNRSLFLKHYERDSKRQKYYDLKPFIENTSTQIYYIVPLGSVQDEHAYEHVKDCENIKAFCFNSSHHGVVIRKNNLSKLISLTNEELNALWQRYQNDTISVLKFSIHFVGIWKTLCGYISDAYKFLRKKLNESRSKKYASRTADNQY